MPPADATAPDRPRRRRRALLWGALLALLGVAQTLLVVLTVSYESTRAQDEADSAAAEVAADVRRELLRAMQQLQALAWADGAPAPGRDEVAALLRTRQDLRRVEWRNAALAVTEARDTPYGPPLFGHMARGVLQLEAELACNAARRAAAPMFSRSYFVPLPEGLGVEVLDLCVPVPRAAANGDAGADSPGFIVASFALAPLLEAALPARATRLHEFSFVEGDGTRLARAGVPRGAGVYVGERLVDLPGTTLQLRADAGAGRPSLIPNLTLALVLGLSLALFSVVWVLARDVRRRAQAERALAEALAFRQAMENSLPTGLRARDLEGMVTYVNPAFCAMVGFTPEELRVPPPGHPPYWPPEFAPEYERRQQERLSGPAAPGREAREGHETVFMRKGGERFPVMIYEAPLVDGQGRHTGWMGAVVDLGAQRRVEELSRQQQDRLQATARLATVGEMASLLSHELNQPLAAIASYASGSLNLLETPSGDAPPDPELRAMLHGALTRIAEQAERAGRVIKSVHDFVRRREQLHEAIDVRALLDAVLPLARMQARKSGTRLELDLPPDQAGTPRVPRVRCDRTMVEQVLLNLARNGIQAMESRTPPAERVLTLRVRQTHERWVTFSVIDAGPGIPAEVARRLFTPFFTTKAEGMGLGLSLCRTVIEQHGGALDYGPGPGGRGTEFRFTLPAAPQREQPPAPSPDAAARPVAPSDA
ncbi:MAG: PAS domain S-box protein [Rubrivivax sp.]|nr:PAS domain S-box protein [Rubrivivax sp.]